jgi:O-antigen/teichoic acid export membrane protein
MQGNRHHFLTHTGIYLVARGLPGLVAFLAIPIFSRLLTPLEYGRYALVVAAVGVINSLLFQWGRMSVVRYLPAYRDDLAAFKSTLVTTSMMLMAALGVVSLLLPLLPIGREYRLLIFPSWILLASQVAFELASDYARADLRPWHVMRLQLARSGAIVLLGSLLVWLGWGWWGPVGGMMGGSAIAVAVLSYGDWHGIRWQIDRPMLSRVAKYGVPLSLTVALASVVFSSDRFLIAGFLGEAKAGVYSAAVDFTSQTLTLLLTVVNSAMFPLAVRALEDHGEEAARDQMRYNASLLLGIGLPCVVAFSLLSPGIAHIFIGKDFRPIATNIIPLIALGAFLSGLKAYHFDAAFQFADRTLYQVWIILAAAVLNVVFNVIAIPRWGINGSAVASVCAYVLSIGLTAVIGRRSFRVPFPVNSLLIVLASAGLMGLALFPFRTHLGPIPFAGQVLLGGSVYALGLLTLNFLGVRDYVLNRWRSREGRTSEGVTSHEVGDRDCADHRELMPLAVGEHP